MKWVLLFWINMPSNYIIHSEYKTEQDCLTAQERYSKIFQQTNSRTNAVCRPYENSMKQTKSNIVYKKVTIL